MQEKKVSRGISFLFRLNGRVDTISAFDDPKELFFQSVTTV